MSLKRRLSKLEHKGPPSYPVPPVWTDNGDVGGFTWRGEFLTWEEYERRYPDGPKVLRWAEAKPNTGETP